MQELALWDFKFGEKYPLKFILEGYGHEELFAQDFDKYLNFWKIYRALTSLRYCLDNNKPEAVNSRLATMKESLNYFN
jgi:hypothetical protein